MLVKASTHKSQRHIVKDMVAQGRQCKIDLSGKTNGNCPSTLPKQKSFSQFKPLTLPNSAPVRHEENEDFSEKCALLLEDEVEEELTEGCPGLLPPHCDEEFNLASTCSSGAK